MAVGCLLKIRGLSYHLTDMTYMVSLTTAEILAMVIVSDFAQIAEALGSSDSPDTAFIASRGGWLYCDDSRVQPTDAKEVVVSSIWNH